MDFSLAQLTPDEEELRSQVRAVLRDGYREDLLAAEMRDPAEHIPSLHRALGERGWLFPQWPVQWGGAGLSEREADLVELELVLHDYPAAGRHTTQVGANAVRAFGGEWLKNELLLPAARGEICTSLGWTESEAGSDLLALKTSAIEQADGSWLVKGQKVFSTTAQFSSHTLLLARSDPDSRRSKGLTLFMVPYDLPGVDRSALRTWGVEQTNIVIFDRVVVDDRFRVGPVGQGWRVMQNALAQEHGEGWSNSFSCGEVYFGRGMEVWLAVTKAALSMVNAPSDGSVMSIAAPGALDRVLGMALKCELLRDTPPGSANRILSADVMAAVGSELIDLGAPASLLPFEQDGAAVGGWLEHLYRSGPGASVPGGTVEVHRNMLAERVLGLPRAGR